MLLVDPRRGLRPCLTAAFSAPRRNRYADEARAREGSRMTARLFRRVLVMLTAVVVYASDEEQAVPNVEAEASARGLRLMPTISNSRHHRWDGALIHTIINDPRTRSRHVAAIVELVRSHGWDGI